jgi:phosphotriesterase-related protein
MRVMTVLGPVAPEALGATLMHEHIIIDLRHSLYAFDAILDDVELAVDELRRFKAAGGGTVVDVTNKAMGRDVRAQERIARESGVHIVAATGYYTEPYYPPEVYELSTNRLADRIVAELTEGIDGTGVRAGIIAEIGTGRDFLKPAEERVFRAAARAQRRTGAAIMTHTFLEQLIPDQLAILEEEGVEPSRIIIGHLGDRRDLDRLRAIADTGVYLGIDHIGAAVHQRDDQRARTVAQLIRHGHLDQLLLSMDICMKSRLHWYGGTGYDHLQNVFVPLLREAGVTQAEIETMLIDNPRRVLAFDV